MPRVPSHPQELSRPTVARPYIPATPGLTTPPNTRLAHPQSRRAPSANDHTVDPTTPFYPQCGSPGVSPMNGRFTRSTDCASRIPSWPLGLRSLNQPSLGVPVPSHATVQLFNRVFLPPLPDLDMLSPPLACPGPAATVTGTLPNRSVSKLPTLALPPSSSATILHRVPRRRQGPPPPPPP